MGALSQQIEDIKARFQVQIDLLKVRIFGPNNERLDFLMDSFNKLDQARQRLVIFGVFAVIVSVVYGAFAFYFAQISQLKDDLSESYQAIRQLDELAGQFKVEEKRFDALVGRIRSKTSSINSYKSYFEGISKKEAVKISSLNDRPASLPELNPLSNYIDEVSIDIDVENVSLPRIMRYLVAIEKDGRYLRVSSLKVRSRYGTKLFFDSQMTIKGYKVK